MFVCLTAFCLGQYLLLCTFHHNYLTLFNKFREAVCLEKSQHPRNLSNAMQIDTFKTLILEAYVLYLNSDNKKVSLKGLLTDISTHGFFACKTATQVCILSNKSICFRLSGLLKGTFELLDNFRSLHYYHLLFLTF